MKGWGAGEVIGAERKRGRERDKERESKRDGDGDGVKSKTGGGEVEGGVATEILRGHNFKRRNRMTGKRMTKTGRAQSHTKKRGGSEAWDESGREGSGSHPFHSVVTRSASKCHKQQRRRE